jgi:hypothetical protein
MAAFAKSWRRELGSSGKALTESSEGVETQKASIG